MKIGDKVHIITVKEKYKPFMQVGTVGTIMQIYGQGKQNIGVNIAGVRNPNSQYGYFYFSADQLAIHEHNDIIDGLWYGMLKISQNNDMQKCVRRSLTLIPEIENVKFNGPATIVFWSDGIKTVVKANPDEAFDPEKGLAMAITKRVFGNKHNYYHKVKHWLKKYKEQV